MGRFIIKILFLLPIPVIIFLVLLILFGDPVLASLSKIGIPLTPNHRIFIIFGLVIFCFVCSITAALLKKSLRRREMQGLAHQYNWTYTQKADLPFLSEFANYLDINHAHPLRATSENVIMGQMFGRNFLVSDQSYVTGSRKSRKTVTQTIVGIEIKNGQLPIFCLCPEGSKGLFNAIFNILDQYDRDIDFANHPVFSQKYLLYGLNEAAIRQMFNAKVISFYEQNPLFTTIGGGKYIVIYNPQIDIPAKQIPEKINFIVHLADLLSGQK